MGKRSDDGIHADPHLSIDGHGFRFFDGDAADQKLQDFAVPNDAVCRSQFHAVVDAQHFIAVVHFERNHMMSGANEDCHHVGQIVLAVLIVGANLARVFPEKRGVEAEDTGVDFANGALLGCAVFLFHDFAQVTGSIANHTAIAGGVGHFCCNYRGRRAAGSLRFRQCQQGPGRDKRTIADRNDQAAAQMSELFLAA